MWQIEADYNSFLIFFLECNSIKCKTGKMYIIHASVVLQYSLHFVLFYKFIALKLVLLPFKRFLHIIITCAESTERYAVILNFLPRSKHEHVHVDLKHFS